MITLIKSFILFLALFLIPFCNTPINAISLIEIQNNPERYEKIENLMTPLGLYIDKESVKSLRYEPPYYNIRATIYLVFYDGNRILSEDTIYSYNLNYSAKSYAQRIEKNITSSKSEKLDIWAKKLTENCGIQNSIQDRNSYDLNGVLKSPLGRQLLPKNIQMGSADYLIANQLFYNLYNQYFSIPNDFFNNLYMKGDSHGT